MRPKTALNTLAKIFSAEGFSTTIRGDLIQVDTAEVGPVVFHFNADTQHLRLLTCVILDHPSDAENNLRVVNQLNVESDGARFYLLPGDTSIVCAESAYLVYTRTLSRALVADSLSHFVNEIDYSRHVLASEDLSPRFFPCGISVSGNRQMSNATESDEV